MLVFIGLTTAVLVSTLGLAHWSFEQGFRDYAKAIELVRLKKVSKQLGILYRENNRNWSLVEPSILLGYLNYLDHYPHKLTREVLVPQKNKGINYSGIGSSDPENRLTSFEIGHHPVHPTALFNLQRRRLLGADLDWYNNDLVDLPVIIDGEVVAYLKSSPLRLLKSSIETGSSKHWTTGGFIAAKVLFLALIVSLILDKLLLKPIRKLIDGVNEISKGNYSQQFSENGSDEFGRLMDDINHLTHTLKKTQETRQRWLADISHELRTPLTVLTADVELLKEGVRPFSDESLFGIDHEVTALRSMTDDLYQLSVSDIGGLSYEYADINLKDHIVDAINAYRSIAEAKGIDLVFSETDDFVISADSKRIKQLLSNLLKNSINYTDAPGKVEVKLRTNKRKVLLMLSDTAPSPGTEDCTLLFEPLYRNDDLRSSWTSGAGLGLAICRNIVEAHRGEIVAAPSSLGGLVICIVLPFGSEKKNR